MPTRQILSFILYLIFFFSFLFLVRFSLLCFFTVCGSLFLSFTFSFYRIEWSLTHTFMSYFRSSKFNLIANLKQKSQNKNAIDQLRWHHWLPILFADVLSYNLPRLLMEKSSHIINTESHFIFYTTSHQLFCNLVQNVKIYFHCAHTRPLLLCAIGIFVLTQLRINISLLNSREMVIVSNDITLNVKCVESITITVQLFGAIWWPSTKTNISEDANNFVMSANKTEKEDKDTQTASSEWEAKQSSAGRQFASIHL